MGYITIWYDPKDTYLKEYHDHKGNVTKKVTKTIRMFYESVMIHINKHPEMTARIVTRPKDGYITVDAKVNRKNFIVPKR